MITAGLLKLRGFTMLKTMTAKYRGRCTATGKNIKPGDSIEYNTSTRTAVLLAAAAGKPFYRSDIFNINGNEYYRNKQGRCIDAPCCGCCTI